MNTGQRLWFSVVVAVVMILSMTMACTSAPALTPASPTSVPAKTPASPSAAPAATQAAPAASKSGESAGPAPATVKVGLKADTSDAGIYIAREKGYFKEQGITIEEKSVATIVEALAPLATGELDVAGGAVTPGVFNAIQRDIPLRIVADKGSTAPGNGYMALVVRKDLWDQGVIKDFGDLKGKNVGVMLAKAGTSNHVDLDIALSKVGLTWKDVNLVDLTFPDMNAAFAGKSIDAAIHIEPHMTKGAAQGLFVRWKGIDEIYPNHQIAIVAYSAQFAKDKADVAKRFMVAYLKGVRDYNNAFVKNDKKLRDEIIPILIKNTSLKEPELYDKLVFPGLNPDGYANADSVARDQDWYTANGFVKQKLDLKQVIDNQFVDYAIQTLGKYKN